MARNRYDAHRRYIGYTLSDEERDAEQLWRSTYEANRRNDGGAFQAVGCLLAIIAVAVALIWQGEYSRRRGDSPEAGTNTRATREVDTTPGRTVASAIPKSNVPKVADSLHALSLPDQQSCSIFNGRWYGTVAGSQGSQYDLTLELFLAPNAVFAGEMNSSTLDCHGRLIFQSMTDGTLALEQIITHGEDRCDNRTVFLWPTSLSENALVAHWPGTATAGEINVILRH